MLTVCVASFKISFFLSVFKKIKMKEKQKKRKAYEPKLTPEGILGFKVCQDAVSDLILIPPLVRLIKLFPHPPNRNDGLFNIQEVLGKCGQHFGKLGGCGFNVIKYVTFSGCTILIGFMLKQFFITLCCDVRARTSFYKKSCTSFSAADDDELPQELLLGKHQLSELGSESAKIKAMGITCRVRCFWGSNNSESVLL